MPLCLGRYLSAKERMMRVHKSETIQPKKTESDSVRFRTSIVPPKTWCTEPNTEQVQSHFLFSRIFCNERHWSWYSLTRNQLVHFEEPASHLNSSCHDAVEQQASFIWNWSSSRRKRRMTTNCREIEFHFNSFLHKSIDTIQLTRLTISIVRTQIPLVD